MTRDFYFLDAGWPAAQLSCDICSWEGCADEALVEDSFLWSIVRCPRCPQPPILKVIVYATLNELIEATDKLIDRDRKH